MGCGSSQRPRGALMVVIDTALTPGRDFDRLALRVAGAASSTVSYRYAWDERSSSARVLDGGFLPLSVSVQNANETQASRVISLVAWRGGVPVFAREVDVVLPFSETRTLRLEVDTLCFGARGDGAAWAVSTEEDAWARSCSGALTCVSGQCSSPHVDANELPAFDPRAVFGGEVGPDRGGTCVDLQRCLRGASSERERPQRFALRPRRSSAPCALDVGQFPSSAGFTVAVIEETARGSCGSEGCATLLREVDDPERATGWTRRSGRLFLSSSLCRDWRTVVVRRADGACEAATASHPLCSEWSSLGDAVRSTHASDATARWSFSGGTEVGVVCASLTASPALCANGEVRAGCGDVLVPDQACAGLARDAACGACTGATDDMVHVSGASFTIGSSDEALARGEALENELPLCPVSVAPFWLDRLEVSTAQFYSWCEGPGADRDACARAAANEPPCTSAALSPEFPMNCVDWASANAYCRAHGKRLPTEEEWDLAARGVARRRFPWGDEPPDEKDVCTASLQRIRVTPCNVGSSRDDVTPEGIRDLGGNVLEWTSSGGSARFDAPRSTAARVLRGGAWVAGEANSASLRQPESPSRRNLIVGFRCAK